MRHRRPIIGGAGGQAIDVRYYGIRVPEEGLEPSPSCEDWILSPARLPFRHSGERLAIQQFAAFLGACQRTAVRVAR